ncbi:MAG: VWA domain-containing protein [Bacteroidia bacterium]|nr:VWA domain-containing protein [Bacteroidia bacterium]
MRKIVLSALCAGLIGLAGCANAQTTPTDPRPGNTNTRTTSERKIQVALLLDTSNSMDGLIEQAKSRLWNIVNTLSTLKYEGKSPQIEIALYEYGNDGLESADHYIRRVVPLSTDLDLISEKLFALRTNGGSEYCGAVISKSMKDLEWSNDTRDMKLIYIAGNEPFNQGPVSYKEICKDAVKKNIYINTIYCGGKDQGITDFWQDGAVSGEGRYFNIDANRQVLYVVTPYDVRINELNIKLNGTYIGYGSLGAAKKENQVMQDENAQKMASANMVERTVSKGSSAYRNDDWDLVDAEKNGKLKVEDMKESELPAELKGKSAEERKKYVEAKGREREEIQKEISELGRKRQAYIDEEMKKQGDTDDLGAAITNSVMEFANKKGYKASNS